MIRIMRERYRLYRSYGHPPFIAASLAPPPEWIAWALVVSYVLVMVTMI